MTEQKRLNDVFPAWVSGSGIFGILQSFPVPWKDENISISLDLEYHGNISGEKIISPLVSKIVSGDVLTETEKSMLATAILAVNGVNWGKQWQTLSFEYDPIENYSMKENMSNDKTITEYGKSTTRTDNLTHGKTGTETRTDNLTHGKTGTETRTDNLTEETTPNLTTNNANSIYGFNSSSAVPTGEQEQTATGSNTVKNTGTEQREYNLSDIDTGTEQREYNLSDTDTGTQSILDGGTDTHTHSYELTRSGNIGVTTSQQMIHSERDLWIWNFFRDVVFPDIDRVLTIQIY